jgi:hypothetical protein
MAVPSALVVAAGALLSASGAQADPGSLVNLSACNTNALSHPFLPWLDPSSYELAPGGTFADSSWSLSDGAAIVRGAEPWGVAGSVSSSSLSLPAGSSAQSPITCDDAAYPTVRFFVGGAGAVAVSVVDGNLILPAGVATSSGGWAPSPPSVTLSAVTGVLSGGTTQVALRFTSIAGNPRVSDVFIDPYGRH